MPSDTEQRPYKVYRAGPRGLRARLRGDDDGMLPPRGPDRGGSPDRPKRTPRQIVLRVLKYVAIAVLAWLLLSFVLFMISAQSQSGSVPNSAKAQLSSAGPMLTSANTVLVLGLDNRPRTGAGSKEPGANFSEAAANTDTIMLWRIGGGVSRRLSIPRDTLVNIPGHGMSKINAAWAYGGAGMALKVIKQFTGLQINHLIVVDLGNFPAFINDIGGVTVRTGRICSNISHGAFTLNLRPGLHHLNGVQALTLARTRENSCNPASNDLTRERMQQEIMNAIKSQLLTAHTFFHLPWAAWDAPKVLQTDMGGLTLMQLFLSAEIGGTAPPRLLRSPGRSTTARTCSCRTRPRSTPRSRSC